MKTPTLSVIMPARNAGPFLEAALQSLRAQTFTDWDLHFFDHDSTDETAEIFERHAAEDRRLIWRDDVTGASIGALRAGLIAGSKSPFVAVADADDLSHPDRFEKTLAVFDNAPEIVAVATALNVMTEAGDTLRISRAQETPQVDYDALPVRGPWMPHPSLVVRRDTYDQVGGYNGFFEIAEDVDLLARLDEVGRLHCLQDPLVSYRLHASSLTATRARDVWGFNTLAVLDAYSRRTLGIDMTWLSPRTIDDFFHLTDAERQHFLANEFLQIILEKQRSGRPVAPADRTRFGQFSDLIQTRNPGLFTQLDAWLNEVGDKA